MAINIPQVDPQTVEPPRIQEVANETTFGGGPGLEAEGQEIQKGAAAAGEIGTFEKIRADQTATEEAQAKMLAAHNDILYNPQTGILGSKGKDALQAQEEGRKRFQDAATQIMGTLHGSTQQGPFQKWVQQQSYDFDRVASAHVDQQLAAHDKASLGEVVANSSALAAAGHGDPNIIKNNLSTIDTNLDNFAKRNRLDSDQAATQKSDVHGNFHAGVVTEMMDQGFYKQAQDYFDANVNDVPPKMRKDIQDYIDKIPKQHEETTKAAQEQFYKANLRTATLDYFDGKMSLGEAQRLFRNDKINEAGYDHLQSILTNPNAMINTERFQSDPQTFNEIRQAQLAGKDPGEINHMILKAAAQRRNVNTEEGTISVPMLSQADGKFLTTMMQNKPPSPRDKYIDAAANAVRDSAGRYLAGSNLDEPTKSKEAEGLVGAFYHAVDSSKVQTTKDIDDLRDHVIKQGIMQRYPGVGKLDKMPDVVIDVNGKVTRLLNPDQHSGLKPKYKIVPTAETESDKKE
jgi:hypothetical protein